MIDLTNVILFALLLIFSLISAFVVPYVKTNVDSTKLAKIKSWVKVAVEAAEQIYKGTGRGTEKKDYVLKFLNEKGYTINFDTIDALIESEVYKLK